MYKISIKYYQLDKVLEFILITLYFLQKVYAMSSRASAVGSDDASCYELRTKESIGVYSTFF